MESLPENLNVHIFIPLVPIHMSEQDLTRLLIMWGIGIPKKINFQLSEYTKYADVRMKLMATKRAVQFQKNLQTETPTIIPLGNNRHLELKRFLSMEERMQRGSFFKHGFVPSVAERIRRKGYLKSSRTDAFDLWSTHPSRYLESFVQKFVL
jgi:hypothetical protein